MLSLKLEIGFAMVKILHPLDGVKRFLSMTLAAILSKFIFMNIFMTGRTIIVLQSGKNLIILA